MQPQLLNVTPALCWLGGIFFVHILVQVADECGWLRPRQALLGVLGCFVLALLVMWYFFG